MNLVNVMVHELEQLQSSHQKKQYNRNFKNVKIQFFH